MAGGMGTSDALELEVWEGGVGRGARIGMAGGGGLTRHPGQEPGCRCCWRAYLQSHVLTPTAHTVAFGKSVVFCLGKCGSQTRLSSNAERE